jgi:hypothetical protein
MSDSDMKEYVSKRMQVTKKHIDRQVHIAKSHGMDVKEPHKYSKHHVMNCGNPNCVMCMNPRKSFGEKTIQELKFEQTEKWTEDERSQNSSDLCGND